MSIDVIPFICFKASITSLFLPGAVSIRTKALADCVKAGVVASGGVNKISDIEKLVELGGIEAAIIGRALYEGTLSLAEAIEATQ